MALKGRGFTIGEYLLSMTIVGSFVVVLRCFFTEASILPDVKLGANNDMGLT